MTVLFDPEPNYDRDLSLVADGAPPPGPAPNPGLLDTFGAAFRQENEVVSLYRRLWDENFTPDPSYNPLPDIKDTPYFQHYADRFAGSHSAAETQAIKRRIDEENADNATLAASGWAGTVASITAGAFNPTTWMIPLGGEISGAMRLGLTGYRVARAAEMAAAFGAGATSSEAILHGTHETRTWGDTAATVSTAAILGGLLGPAISAKLSPHEWRQLQDMLTQDRIAMAVHAGNEQAATSLKGQLMGGTAMPQPAGAAVTLSEPVKPLRTVLGSALDRLDPLSRVFGSKSQAARQAMADLAETPLRMEQNLQGVPTTSTGGPALSRYVQMIRRQREVAAYDEMHRLWTEYRFGNPETTFPRLRAQMERFQGRDNGYMTFETFDQEVAKAMRRGDTHDIPQVQQAAQFLRKHYDEWKDRAIAAKFFPEDVQPKGADSYLNRIWNKQAIAAKRSEFVQKVTDYYRADQAKKAEIKRHLEFQNAQLKSWNDQIAKLEARLGRTERRVAQAEAKVGERARDELPQVGGLNEPDLGGRIVQLQKQEISVAEQAKELADIADLMEELTAQNPMLVPILRATEAKIERRFGKIELIQARRGEAGRAAKRSEKRLRVLEQQLSKAENKQALLEDYLAVAEQFHDAVRAKIEAELGRWEGRSAAEAASAIKAREKYLAERTAAGKAPTRRLTSADSAVDRVVKRILESDRDLPDIELRARAQETTDRILSSADGRLSYEANSGAPIQGFKPGEPPRGPLAARRFAIPDTEIEDFLEPSALHAHRQFLRTIVPDVTLTERFGDTAMTEAFRKINDEYAALNAAATTEKARTALETERQRVISDLAAVRDRIRGVYGFSSETPMRNAARIANAIKNYNTISLMGMSALSSLPDMAGQVFRHGLSASLGDAWLPFFRFVSGRDDVWRKAARQFRAMGIATESFSAGRMHALADITELYRPQSTVERALSWGADRFQLVNLLGPWTDWAKINASMVAGSEILRAAKAVAEGTVTKRQLAQLGESNIDATLARRIWQQFETSGEVNKGVHLPNTADWTDTAARDAFEGAVSREADIAVITPGQDKPLWLSSPVVSVFGQFKSFTAAATQRILLANMQRADAQTLQGLVFSLGIGMLTYRLSTLAAGTKPSDRPQDWIKEAIDRGGLLGWLNEGNVMASKLTRGGVDIYRLIGADKPLSRYASRTVLDQLVGPTAGRIEALTRISGAAASGDWNAGDTGALRRLTAAQNLFYARRLFDEVEGAFNRNIGVEER